MARLCILSSRPPDHEQAIWKWLECQGLQPLIAEVICCCDETKAAVLNRENIQFLVDDDPAHLSQLGCPGSGVLRGSERWQSFLQTIMQRLAISGSADLCGNGFRLEGVDHVSDRGRSPAFILRSYDGRIRKLRICRESRTRGQIVEFRVDPCAPLDRDQLVVARLGDHKLVANQACMVPWTTPANDCAATTPGERLPGERRKSVSPSSDISRFGKPELLEAQKGPV